MIRRILFTMGVYGFCVFCVFYGLAAARLFAEYPVLEAPSLSVQVDLLQRTYYINEPIPVYMTVVNTSAEPVRFSLAQQIFLNFDFRVRNLQNMHVRERDDWQLHKLTSRQDILQSEAARSVTLAPGERFGRVIDITGWLRLVEPGVYELTGYFWMYPQRASYDYRYESNQKRFLLEAPREVTEAIAIEKTTRSEKEIKRMSADETVDYIISAKRRGDWDEYFRFMDLTRLINVFNQYRARYVAADIASRADVMNDFQNFLRVFPSEQIEHHFVQNVTVTRDETTLNERARVECLIVYRTGRLIERKTYHFSLYRKLDRWYVDSYYVINK